MTWDSGTPASEGALAGVGGRVGVLQKRPFPVTARDTNSCFQSVVGTLFSAESSPDVECEGSPAAAHRLWKEQKGEERRRRNRDKAGPAGSRRTPGGGSSLPSPRGQDARAKFGKLSYGESSW